MTLREQIEKRNRLLAEARQLMTAADVSTETRTKIDAMLADAQTMKGDIERLEASAESEERSLPTNRPLVRASSPAMRTIARRKIAIGRPTSLSVPFCVVSASNSVTSPWPLTVE